LIFKSHSQVDNLGIEALTTALNRSAERLQTFWFTFMSLTLYLAITTGTTTHRMLLLGESQTLPLLNLKLPLLGFYVIGPGFFILTHAYFLILLVLLARKAKSFQKALYKSFPSNSRPERFQMCVENALFIQILVGVKHERTGLMGTLLKFIAIMTVIVAPLLVLMLFQLKFLPYHHNWITWWHRSILVIDLMLIWLLWPSYLRYWGECFGPSWARLYTSKLQMLALILTMLVILFSWTIATYPG